MIEKSAAESLVWKREREGGRFPVGGRWANTRLLSAWGICGIKLCCGYALIFCSCPHFPNILPSKFAKIPTWDEHTLTKNCSSRQIHIIVTLRSNLLELAMRGCGLCGCLGISAYAHISKSAWFLWGFMRIRARAYIFPIRIVDLDHYIDCITANMRLSAKANVCINRIHYAEKRLSMCVNRNA